MFGLSVSKGKKRRVSNGHEMNEKFAKINNKQKRQLVNIHLIDPTKVY